jgi:hypothetical protein
LFRSQRTTLSNSQNFLCTNFCVVAQPVSWCSAPTTGQAWCLLSSCCCLLLGVQKSVLVAS